MSFKVPDGITPFESKPQVWSLQKNLLDLAEEKIGSRLPNKKICQPSWDSDGPNLRHTPNFDGAFAELSDCAKSNWRLCIYQLAHETIHLFTQNESKSANLLEEGLAVRFSLEMLEHFGQSTEGLPNTDNYKHALTCFDALGKEKYEKAKLLREKRGFFVDVTAADIHEICSDLTENQIEQLLETRLMR